MAYRQAIALNPKDADTYYNLGIALDNQKKYVEAEVAYRQAIALNPKDADTYYSLGIALFDQKKYIEAEDAYRQAIVLNPKYAAAYNNLGYLFQALKRLKEARELYRKAIVIDPDYKRARANLEEVERLIIRADGAQVLAPEDTSFLDLKEPLTPVRRSVLRIVTKLPSGGAIHGTGFVVGRQGNKAWIMTARHVISEPEESDRVATEIEVDLYGGKLKGKVVARLPAQLVMRGEPGLDVALLVVVGLPVDIEPLKFASLAVKDGMPLTIVGHPGEERWISIAGTLSISSMNIMIINSAQMAGGGSGSPVLNDKKEVIGMVYEKKITGDIEQVVATPLAKLQATMRLWGL